MASRRQERVNGRIVQEVSAAIRNLKHPHVGFATVTRADVSPDLRHAKVFVSVLGDSEQQALSLAALQHSARFLRGELGKTLAMKFTPQLEFLFDRTIAYADEMERLIAEARSSDPHPGATPDESDSGSINPADE